MLLFKQKISNNLTSSNEQPSQTKVETVKEQNDYSLPTISNEKKASFTSIPTHSSINNKRYAYDSPIKDLNKSNNFNTLNTEILTPKVIPNLNSPKTHKNQFYAKVILQNTPSPTDIVYLLENYLTENNYKIYYETSYETDKITFIFQEEKIAFEFTKLIYNKKNENPLYKDIIVHLSLAPNETYIKKNMENKRSGLSPESILKLFNGNSYVKKIKPIPKIYGNINFGIKSPFYNVHEKRTKINKTKSEKSFNGNKFFNKNNSVSGRGDIYGYVGYDGKPLKNYEKLRINVLDTHYKPISSFEFREDDKSRWMSPANFKFY